VLVPDSWWSVRVEWRRCSRISETCSQLVRTHPSRSTCTSHCGWSCHSPCK